MTVVSVLVYHQWKIIIKMKINLNKEFQGKRSMIQLLKTKFPVKEKNPRVSLCGEEINILEVQDGTLTLDGNCAS